MTGPTKRKVFSSVLALGVRYKESLASASEREDFELMKTAFRQRFWDKVERDDFLAHFEAVAQLNDWTYEEKGLQLGSCLRGKVQRVLSISVREGGF